MDEYGSWECLSQEMAQHGHTLQGTCMACSRDCIYATPCGCGSTSCIDLVIGADRSGWAAAA